MKLVAKPAKTGLENVQDVDMFRFERALPAAPAANDSRAESAIAERWARSYKCFYDIAEGAAMQFWMAVLVCNPHLIILNAMLLPRKTRVSQ